MPMESMMRLIIQVGDPSQAKTLSIPIQDRMVVGRGGGEDDSPDIDFSAFGAGVLGMSRHHAVFSYLDDALYIEDLNSTNGTRINGFTIPPERTYRLRNGDELEFGSFRVSVRIVRLPQTSGGRNS
jgi:pSer/pThr/pTyr-binding forkhead associated (FHA) protein